MKRLPSSRFSFYVTPRDERRSSEDIYRTGALYWQGLPWPVERAVGDELVQIEPWLSAETPAMLACQSRLVLQPEYYCDGPSGPTLDTVDFLRGTFTHDPGYRLIRKGFLPFDPWRQRFDWALRQTCEEDGMGIVRRNLDYFGLRLFGGAAARP